MIIKTFSNIILFVKNIILDIFFMPHQALSMEMIIILMKKFFQKNVSSIYAATKVCNEIFANVYNYLYGINTSS